MAKRQRILFGLVAVLVFFAGNLVSGGFKNARAALADGFVFPVLAAGETGPVTSTKDSIGNGWTGNGEATTTLTHGGCDLSN